MFKLTDKLCVFLIVSFLFLSGCAGTKVAGTRVDLTPESEPEPWLELTRPDGMISIMDSLFGKGNWVRVDNLHNSLWRATAGATVRAVAKFSSAQSNVWFGPEELFTVSENFISLTDGAAVDIGREGVFSFLNKTGGQTWSSLAKDNSDARNHVVIFKITGQGNDNYAVGDYVIAWEDLGVEGDYDYNDLVLLLHNLEPVK